MVKLTKPVVIGGGLAVLFGAAAAAYTGLPPPNGWFFRAADYAYKAVKDAAPETIQRFIDEHPVYTAGLEGLVAGGVAGLVIGAASVFFARLYGNKP